jgi:hypothetical protein
MGGRRMQLAANTPDKANSARMGISFRHVFPAILFPPSFPDTMMTSGKP